MDCKDDLYFIGQVLEGNQGAFRHIVERHKDHAFNLALRICCNREEAEEIAQDAFVKAYKSLAQFKMKSSFATWFYRIVYNTSISLVRSRKKAPLSLDDFPADAIDFAGASSSEEEAEAEYRIAIVNFALQKLSEEEIADLKKRFPSRNRVAMPELSSDKRIKDFKEVEQGFSVEQAREETERCMATCIFCEICWKVCPAQAITLNGKKQQAGAVV